MPSLIGKQAVVVGAGMAGLTAARSLANFFERVLVLENDALPNEPLVGREPLNLGTYMSFWQVA